MSNSYDSMSLRIRLNTPVYTSLFPLFMQPCIWLRIQQVPLQPPLHLSTPPIHRRTIHEKSNSIAIKYSRHSWRTCCNPACLQHYSIYLVHSILRKQRNKIRFITVI